MLLLWFTRRSWDSSPCVVCMRCQMIMNSKRWGSKGDSERPSQVSSKHF